jgi:hypothetical protein
MPEWFFPAAANSGYFQWPSGSGKPPNEGPAITVHNYRRLPGKLIVH